MKKWYPKIRKTILFLLVYLLVTECFIAVGFLSKGMEKAVLIIAIPTLWKIWKPHSQD